MGSWTSARQRTSFDFDRAVLVVFNEEMSAVFRALGVIVAEQTRLSILPGRDQHDFSF